MNLAAHMCTSYPTPLLVRTNHDHLVWRASQVLQTRKPLPRYPLRPPFLLLSLVKVLPVNVDNLERGVGLVGPR